MPERPLSPFRRVWNRLVARLAAAQLERARGEAYAQGVAVGEGNALERAISNPHAFVRGVLQVRAMLQDALLASRRG